MGQSSHSTKPSAVDLDGVRGLVEPIAAAHGVRLVDVEWTRARGGRVLRLVIDSDGDGTDDLSSGGVTLDQCVRVSRDASTVLDVADPIDHSYHLEVSSPGLDRPLRALDDFRRAVGSLAKVKLQSPAPDGQRVLRGTVLTVKDGLVGMQVDGNEHWIDLDNVAEARRVVDFGGRSRKPAGSRTKRGRRGPSARRSGRGNGGSRQDNSGRKRPRSRKES